MLCVELCLGLERKVIYGYAILGNNFTWQTSISPSLKWSNTSFINTYTEVWIKCNCKIAHYVAYRRHLITIMSLISLKYLTPLRLGAICVQSVNVTSIYFLMCYVLKIQQTKENSHLQLGMSH